MAGEELGAKVGRAHGEEHLVGVESSVLDQNNHIGQLLAVHVLAELVCGALHRSRPMRRTVLSPNHTTR